MEVSDDLAEETFQVFDHPVVKIYKKDVQLGASDYEELLTI